MKKFCVIPWYSREIDLASGQEQVCCWIQHDVSRSDLQQRFLSGEQPPECNKCWESEANNIESRRQMENRFLDFKMDRDLALLESDVEQGMARPNMYQIFLGSTCNGTCVHCSPASSSAWRGLEKRFISIRRENQQIEHHSEDIFKSINWHEAKRFNLLGGEPLLIDRSFDILTRLLEAGNTDCRVSFVTNGSVTLSPGQIKMVRHFSDISCCVSIDALDRSFEYIRYPLSWPNLLHNLQQYREIFTEVIVSFTLSNLNYHAREDIIAWFKKMGLLYIENYVIAPDWFNHEVQPGHTLWKKFVSEINRQDRLKGIDIKDYIPEIYQKMQQHA